MTDTAALADIASEGDWGPFGRPLFDDPSARALSRGLRQRRRGAMPRPKMPFFAARGIPWTFGLITKWCWSPAVAVA